MGRLRIPRLRIAGLLVICVLAAVVALPGQSSRAEGTSFTLIGRADGGVPSGTRLVLGDMLVIVSDDSGAPVRYTIDLRWVRDKLPPIDQDDQIEVDIQVLPDGTLVATSVENVSGRSGTANQGISTGSRQAAEQPESNAKEDEDRSDANTASTDLTATPTRTVTATTTATRTVTPTGTATPTATPTGT